MPGSTFKMITTAIGLEAGVIDLDSQFPNARRRGLPPQTTDPIENYDGEHVRRRPDRGVPPQLQHPVRPDRRSNIGADGDGRRRRPTGASASRSRSTCPAPAASTFGNVDDFDQQPAAPGHRAGSARATTRWCRCTWRWSPPTVANGGQMMKPYVVRARRVDHDGSVLDDAPTPEVWKTPITPADGGDAATR